MAVASKPLHRPPLSSLPLEGDKARSLLGREITLYFGGADKKANSVVTTVGEIYRRCQKTLSEEFRPTPLFIRGSSVAHLYSKEPFSDIDIHATIDSSNLSPDQRVAKGYAIKWAVLKGISEIIAEKFPPTPGGSKISIASGDILYKEENATLCSTGAPYNVHTIRFPGDIPIEFTLFNIIKPVEESVRNYDFNSGSLQLCIEEDGGVTVHSSTSDIRATIKELERRELTCTSPEEITRKGICRYLAKLVLSGYYDKDKELLHTLVDGVKSRDKGKTGEKILAAKIADEILAHFKEKGVNPSVALLSLWLLPAENPFLKIIIGEAKEKLKASLLMDSTPEKAALSTLIQKGKKAESCWYLALQAKTARRVLHRGEESLQLEIPSYPLFASSPTDSSVFIIVPVSGLAKFSESIIPEAFIDLQQVSRPKVEVEADTKPLFQQLCKDVLTKHSLYPVLSTAIDRFGIQAGPDFSNLFIEWVEGIADSEKLRIPLPALLKVVEGMKEGLSIKDTTTLFLLKRIYELVGKESLSSLDSVALQKNIAKCVHDLLRKEENWRTLPPADLAMIIDFAKAHLENHGKKEKLEAYKRIGEESLTTRTLSILYMLYTNGRVGLAEGILGARLCFQLGYRPHGVKFLQMLAKTQTSLDAPEIHSLFEMLQESYPLEFATFLKENAQVIKEKSASFSLIIDPFLEKLTRGKSSPDLIAKFFEVVDALCEKQEKQNLMISLFKRAAKGNVPSKDLLEPAGRRLDLSILDFYPVSEMDKEELKFLSELPGFDDSLSKNSDFAIAIVTQAALLKNYELVVAGSHHLAKTDPEKCLLSLAALNSLRKDSADLTTLPASVDILVQLLDTYPSFVTNRECKALIQARLEDLSRYLAANKGKDLDQKFFTTLQKLHKQAALYTIENSCWPSLWEIARASNMNKVMKDWISPEELVNTLPAMNPNGNIRNLIESFTLDAPIIYELLREVSELDQGTLNNFVLLVQLLLRKGRGALLAEAPAEPPVEAREVVSVVGRLYKSIRSPDTTETFYTAMDFASFTAAYGCRQSQEKLLVYLDNLHNTKDIIAKGLLESTPIPHNLLFGLAKRAMEKKDLAMLSRVASSYKAWGRQKTPDKYFDLKELNSLCQQWQGCLKEIFSDPTANKALSAESLELQILQFYSLFLTDTFKIREVPSASGSSDHKIKEARFTYLLNFIDFLSRKKLIASVCNVQELVGVTIDLEPEQLGILATRFTTMAVNMAEEMEKQLTLEKNLVVSLLECVSKVVYSVENSEKAKASSKTTLPKVLMDFLLKARSLSLTYPFPESVLSRHFQYIEFLQGTLSKIDRISYHLSLAESILKRKGAVKPEEIMEWFAFIPKLDPKLSDGTIKDLDSERYMHGGLIPQEPFNKALFIRSFLDMINLLFKMLPRGESGITFDESLQVDKILFCFRSNLETGIDNIKKERPSEGKVVDKLYVDTLLMYLMVSKKHCDPDPLTYLYNFGRFEEATFKGKSEIGKKTGATFEENIKILYLILLNQHLVPKEFNTTIEIIKKGLKGFYQSYKKDISKSLRPEDISLVEYILGVMDKPEAMSVKAAGGAASSKR